MPPAFVYWLTDYTDYTDLTQMREVFGRFVTALVLSLRRSVAIAVLGSGLGKFVNFWLMLGFFGSLGRMPSAWLKGSQITRISQIWHRWDACGICLSHEGTNSGWAIDFSWLMASTAGQLCYFTVAAFT